MLSISVIAPVFNEIENLGELCRQLDDTLAALAADFWEIILVNDGSNDGSGEWLHRFCRGSAHFKAIHFETNQGQTAAFAAGIGAAKGDFLVTMDADLQNDPRDIPFLLEAMTDKLGAVCGVRTKRRDNWIRRVSSRIANGIRNWITGDNVVDTGCSLKLFRRECFNHIPLFEGMHRFFPTLVKMAGYEVAEIPLNHRERFGGTSKYGVLNRVLKSFLDLLAVRWMKYRFLKYKVVEQPNPLLTQSPVNEPGHLMSV